MNEEPKLRPAMEFIDEWVAKQPLMKRIEMKVRFFFSDIHVKLACIRINHKLNKNK